MKSFKLTNLRELSSEEQLKLNGGFTSQICEATCSECDCYCKCTSDYPKDSSAENSADTGAVYTKASKEREAMSSYDM